MPDSSIAIRVSNLGKCYHVYDAPHDRLKQFVIPRLLRLAGRESRDYFRQFWALKNVSFEVRVGETVGIVGRNGSGKSTLLQMICGTLSPTEGVIEVKGRIAGLLELGSGFDPEFTGRENVYMNASLLGLTRNEIESRLETILAFADIGRFIDQPVKTYSSGMVVRLAFAVQSQIDPDVLVVDEALSVGDAKFQAKCFERLRQLKARGTSILLVTHATEQVVAHCSTAILLDGGIQLQTGEPRNIVNRYMDLLFGKTGNAQRFPSGREAGALIMRNTAPECDLSSGDDCFAKRQGYNPHEYRWGDGDATILDFCLAADDQLYPSVVSAGQRIRLTLSIAFHRELHRPIMGITVKTKEGVTVYGVNSESLECDDFRQLGRCDSVVRTEAVFICRLAPGDYFISLGIATMQEGEVIPHDRRYDSIHLQVRPDSSFVGIANLNLEMMSAEICP